MASLLRVHTAEPSLLVWPDCPILTACSLSPKKMPLRSETPSIGVASCPPLSSYAGGFHLSPTMPLPGNRHEP
jgi:hypothetical protein